MISLVPYTSQRAKQAHALAVKTDQEEFTIGNVEEFIATLSETEHPQLILINNQVVGFFLLDVDYSARYPFSDTSAIGVRALLIDEHYQGHGIAKRAINALPDYIKMHYPQFLSIQLTVNCRNSIAYDCYLKSGFNDTGRLYLGGPVGPQRIMECVIG
ncbi:acetyltransferase [Photobacterium jeanii]|uniref:Acetyltransferase n=1 Tax=Photobacterium jeanii TaxID=858640 RepID=A0A178K2P8_9GAMM|nr:GNAT family N-acetyltransferase [Photobacterium jeanii]OAN11589.1 acetyltransferase [Photobacterium jeanii]PST91111.1 N-acetyltransferase [Photobacterium jeanii]